MHYERRNNNRFHNVEFNQFWHSLMHVWIKGADRPTTYACSCHDHLVPRAIFVEGFTITGIMEFAGRFPGCRMRPSLSSDLSSLGTRPNLWDYVIRAVFEQCRQCVFMLDIVVCL